MRARAAQFAPAEVRRRVFNPMVRPRWMEGTDRFWYPHEGPGGIEYVAVDAATGARTNWAPEPAPAVDQRQGDAVSPDLRWAAFRRGDDLWLREIATGLERALTTDGAPQYAYAKSPDMNLTPVTLERRGIK